MFKLRVVFRGQCAFAPKSDGTELKIFLPDESQIQKKRPESKIIPHHAAVTVRARHLFASGDSTPGRVVWFLVQQRIRIIPPSASGKPSPLAIEGFDYLGTPKEPSLVRQPQVGDGGFWWLAPLERACLARHLQAGGGVLDQIFLADKLQQDAADLLAARVEITTGKLRIATFLKNDKDFIVWRFRNFNGSSFGSDHSQILAGSVLLEQDIDGDLVTIEGVSLANPDDATQKSSLTLYPRDDGDGPMVDLEILNEEGDQFMPVPVDVPVTRKAPHDEDRVFELLYQLSKNPPPPDEFPMPVADYFVPDTAGRQPAQSAPPCSPSRFDPYS